MTVPLAYNLRSMLVRRTTTIMTALGITLAVAMLVADQGLVDGLEFVFRASGKPLQMLALRIGSESELQSSISRESYQDIKWKPGIARDAVGQPMASLEFVTVINLPSLDIPRE
jgi:putative ABC transport system permease protein